MPWRGSPWTYQQPEGGVTPWGQGVPTHLCGWRRARGLILTRLTHCRAGEPGSRLPTVMAKVKRGVGRWRLSPLANDRVDQDTTGVDVPFSRAL